MARTSELDVNASPSPEPLELTVRAVLAGCAIGALLAVGNVYMGLKTGWTDSGNITAAILGFAFFAAQKRRPYTELENNITQTVGSAIAQMPSATGLLAAFPALSLLGYSYGSWKIIAWGAALGTLGVLIALALRQQLIVEEKLPFPTSIATAEVIRSMRAATGQALGRARTLIGTGCAAALFEWFRDGRWKIIPQMVALPGQIFGTPAATLTLGLSLSPMMVGAGLLVGVQTGVSLLLGSLLAWGVSAPWLLKIGIVKDAEYGALISWLTWPGVALMVSATVVSLAVEARTFARTIGDLRSVWQHRRAPSGGAKLRALWVLAWVLVLLLLGWRMFGIHPLIGLVVLALSVLLASVCARASGQTDMVPLGTMGQLTQLIFAPISVGKAGLNIGVASVVAGDAAQTAAMLGAFKTGTLLGASTKRQTSAQLVGVFVGAFIGVPVYWLVTRAYGIGTTSLPAQSAVAWRAIAEVVAHGQLALPAYAKSVSAIAFAAGILLTLLARTSIGKNLPIPLAMGIGFITPAFYSLAICVGAFLFAAFRAIDPDATERHTPAVAAGLIAGEALMGVVIAVLILLGLQAP